MQQVAVGHELAFTRTESPVMAVRFATGNAGLQENQSGSGGPFPTLSLVIDQPIWHSQSTKTLPQHISPGG
jgi:hypothetical protein